jgi:hypothetical protein
MNSIIVYTTECCVLTICIFGTIRKNIPEKRYDFRHGKKTLDGLKSCHEITNAKIAVTNIAEFCLGKQTTFSI